MINFARRVFRKLHPSRTSTFNRLDFRASYIALVKHLKETNGTEQAMEQAVGGHFEKMGFLEWETLKHFGLQEDSYLIDVGCGSGRLAKPLAQYLKGRYLGTDVVPDLVNHARKIAGRPDWRFEVVTGLSIPEEAGAADMVCFFSVFTHLLHEHTYAYLQEAKRVLKPGGTIVWSFLDFAVPGHWHVFEANIRDKGVAPVTSICSSARMPFRSGRTIWGLNFMSSKRVIINMFHCPRPSVPRTEGWAWS